MRAAARIATVITVAMMTAVVGGGWGSALSAPAYAPTRGMPVSPSTAARLGSLRADDVVRIGTAVVREGVAVPRGTTPVGPPRTFADGSLRGWETVLDLGGVSATTALGLLRTDLVAQGFEVRSGSHDVFGARQRDGRWEIVVARVQTRDVRGGAHDEITIGVGSRAA